jgi:hypothetical protein
VSEQQLRREILALSGSPVWEIALPEWNVSAISFEERPDDDRRYICVYKVMAIEIGGVFTCVKRVRSDQDKGLNPRRLIFALAGAGQLEGVCHE